MTLNLNATEHQALFDAFRQIVVPDNSDNPTEQLLIALMHQVYRKLHVKSIQLQRKYRITLTPAETIAFMLYWQNAGIAHTTYEGNLINTIVHKANQIYA